MAFCRSCGAKLPDDAKFCTYCGDTVTVPVSSRQQKFGVITFSRLSANVAQMVKTSVIIDGVTYAELKQNEQITVQLPYGTHSLTLKAALNPAYNTTIVIDDYNNNVFYQFKIKMNGKPEPVGGYGKQAAISSPVKPVKAKKTGGWAIAILVLVVIFVLVRAIGSSDSDSSSPKSTSKPVSTKVPVTTETPSVQTYSIGDKVVFDDLEVTVTGYTFSRTPGNFKNFQAASRDDAYLVVYIDITNPTSERKKLSEESLIGAGYSTYNFTIIYDNDYKYLSSYADYTDFLLANDSIMPLGSLTGKVLSYKVPVLIQNTDKSIVLEMSYNSSKTGSVTWVLR